MSRTKRVTIKDVAREVGVSTQTVSRVVNNRPNVLPRTRDQVQQAIVRLGYSPNVLARGLSQGRSYTLGVIGFGLRYFGSTSVLTGVEQKSNELGYSMLLSLLDQLNPARIEATLRNLISRQVEGIIWTVPGNSETSAIVAAMTRELPVPVVFLNSEAGEGQTVAAVNNRQGARLVTQHLLDQGYLRIGIITGPAGWWEATEREVGWREALTGAGHTDLSAVKIAGDWSPASGESSFQALYENAPEIDAVFVSNDQMALGVLQAARDLELQVPYDLGVAGFDDIPEGAYFHPSLTTVRQCGEVVGAVAVEQISHLIEARHLGETSDSTTCWVEPRLIVRKSSCRRDQCRPCC